MSTLKVSSIQNPSTSSGGVSIDTSGHVTVDGVAMPSSGPLSNRNLVINGAMQVAQRGTSQTSVSDSSNEGYQTLDRFAISFANSAGGVCTISQDTDVPSNQGFGNSYKIDVTTADTSIDPTHQIYVSHKIEAQNVRNSGWNYTSASSYATLSFWAKSSKAGTYCVTIRADDVGNKYYVFEYTLAANTWTKVTHSVPGDSSLVFNNDTGTGLELRWVLVIGTDRDDATADQWNAVSNTNAATSNQVNFFDSTSNDFYLTGVQLEVGSVATPFEHRSYGDELARCQRYYEELYVFSDAGTTYIRENVQFKQIKRANPTGYVYAQTPGGSGTNTVNKVYQGSGERTASVSNTSVSSARLDLNPSTFTANQDITGRVVLTSEL